jgi:broad specificity phosphatase PhoE
MDVSNEQAEAYAEGVRRGGTIITVTAPEPRTNEAVTIINRHDPVNINERMSEWHASGWAGHDINAEPYTPQDVARERQKHQGYTY